MLINKLQKIIINNKKSKLNLSKNKIYCMYQILLLQ